MTGTRRNSGTDRPENPALRLDPSRPVRVVTEHASVAEALRAMRAAGIRHLPVIADDRCVGLLVDRHLIAAVVDGDTTPVGRLAHRPSPRWRPVARRPGWPGP